MSLRGGRSRFVVESKLFEIVVEESGGKLKGCIWERSRGFDSWIRFGEASLRCLLEGVETCCREVDDQRWAIEWLEGNRKFRMERRMNKAGSGWNSLAVRLRGLGVTPTEGLKFTNVPEAPLKPKGVLKVQCKEKRVEMKSFAEAVKSTPRRAGESVWLEAEEKEVRGRLEHLKHCLIGRWGSISAPLPELDFVRIWTRQNWEVKGKLSIAVLGRGIILFEFEQAQEAERVLARAKRSFRENWLILDKWNPEVGCSFKNSIAVETWVRVVGLPLHLWCLEVIPAGSSSGKGRRRSCWVSSGGLLWESKEEGGVVGVAGGEGTDERRWVGDPADLVGGGRESSPINFCLENRVDLGRDPRPNPLSLREGVSGEACGPVQAGALADGLFMETRPQSRFLGLGFCSRIPYPEAQVKMQEEKLIPRRAAARLDDTSFLSDDGIGALD
ncbi:hypothetical protein CK203_056981 [Vitis vinifera]|uniref:DUF4283 domain-containing protein n=1 Tax=Vitis vinifera TaxID=29760 RepID=A0A438GN40_VITVI|nr:hypothetical protein CK203_056981 [Vitis vinifera]